jgi:hypothetical protein
MSGSGCTLHAALGRDESCPEVDCPLWSREESACVLREVRLEILCRPPLAEHLLELRTRLEAARAADSR